MAMEREDRNLCILCTEKAKSEMGHSLSSAPLGAIVIRLCQTMVKLLALEEEGIELSPNQEAVRLFIRTQLMAYKKEMR